MSKHTPAPWHNGLDASGNPIVFQKYDGDLLGSEPNEEYQANCRLVSAAPEMLEALRVAEQFMSIAVDWNFDEAEINGEMRSTYDWIEVIQAAIAKATGE